MSTGRVRRRASTLVLCAIAGVLPACGGGGSPAAPPPPPAPPTTTLPPATLADLSASTMSPQAGRQLNCRTAVKAVVTLTNRAASSVGVTGVESKSRIVKGNCFPAEDFTYQPSLVRLPGGATAQVFNGRLYLSGAGCCVEGSACDGRTTCAIEDAFAVLTGAGSVPAGSIRYNVNFMDCEPCEAASAGRARATGGAPRLP